MLRMFAATVVILAVGLPTVGLAQSIGGSTSNQLLEIDGVQYVKALEEPTETYEFDCEGYRETNEPLAIRRYDAEQPRKIELLVGPGRIENWVLRPMIIRVTECSDRLGNGILETRSSGPQHSRNFQTNPNRPDELVERPLRINLIHRAAGFNLADLPPVFVHRAIYREAIASGRGDVYKLRGRIAGVLGDMIGFGSDKSRQQQIFGDYKAAPESFSRTLDGQTWIRLSGSDVPTLALCRGPCNLRITKVEEVASHGAATDTGLLGTRTSGVQYVDGEPVAVESKALERLVTGRCDALYNSKANATLEKHVDDRMRELSPEVFSSGQVAKCAVGKLEGAWSNIVLLFPDEPINLTWYERILPQAPSSMTIAVPQGVFSRFKLSLQIVDSDAEQRGRTLNALVAPEEPWIISSDFFSTLSDIGKDGRYACKVSSLEGLLVSEVVEDCVLIRDGRADFARDLTISMSPRTVLAVLPVEGLNRKLKISNDFVRPAIFVDGSSLLTDYNPGSGYSFGVINRKLADVQNADVTCQLEVTTPYASGPCKVIAYAITGSAERIEPTSVARESKPMEIDLRLSAEIDAYRHALKFEIRRVELLRADGMRLPVLDDANLSKDVVLRTNSGVALRPDEELVITVSVSSNYSALEGDYTTRLDAEKIQGAIRERGPLVADLSPPRQIVDPSKYRIVARSLADGKVVYGSELRCGLELKAGSSEGLELEFVNDSRSGSYVLRSRDGGPVTNDALRRVKISAERPERTGCRVSRGSRLGRYDPNTLKEHIVDVDRTNPIIAFMVSGDGTREYLSKLFPRGDAEKLFWDYALLGTIFELYSFATQQEAPLKARQVYVEKSVPTREVNENILRLGPLPERALSEAQKRTIGSYIHSVDYASLMDATILQDLMDKYRRANISPAAAQLRSEDVDLDVSPVIVVHFSVEQQTSSACKYLELAQINLERTAAGYLIYVPLLDDAPEEPYPDCLHEVSERVFVTPIHRFAGERRNYNQVVEDTKRDFSRVIAKLRENIRKRR